MIRRFYVLIVTAFGVVCFLGGRFGDVSMREPKALLVLLGMIAGWLTLVSFGHDLNRRRPEAPK